MTLPAASPFDQIEGIITTPCFPLAPLHLIPLPSPSDRFARFCFANSRACLSNNAKASSISSAEVGPDLRANNELTQSVPSIVKTDSLVASASVFNEAFSAAACMRDVSRAYEESACSQGVERFTAWKKNTPERPLAISPLHPAVVSELAPALQRQIRDLSCVLHGAFGKPAERVCSAPLGTSCH